MRSLAADKNGLVPPLQEGDKSAESKKRKADVTLLDVGVEVQGQGDVAKSG